MTCVSVSVPLVIKFGGLHWPYGPARLAIRTREREGALSLLHAGGHTLIVDPSLRAPADDEGPLSAEAETLRAYCPPKALDIVFEGPRPPHPGADVAGRFALREVLSVGGPASAGREDAAALAVRTGVAVSATTGAMATISDDLVAWCESSLLLAWDPTQEAGSRAGGAAEDAAPGLLEASSPTEWAATVTGQGLGTPSSAREADLFGALRAAGLLARWPLGGGALLFLTSDTSREALVAALSDHGFERWPMTLGGIQGLNDVRDGEGS